MKALRGGADLPSERTGINVYSEHSLHHQIKQHLAEAGDRCEVVVDGKVVDLVKADGELVEVQTSGLRKLQAKALALARSGRKVRIVYPILAESRVRRLDPCSGEIVSERRSPKRRAFWDLFGELVWATGLVASRRISLEVLLVRASVVRVRDGSGSWRRRGDRTADHVLDGVISSRKLATRRDWLSLIPGGLASPWSSATLGRALGIAPEKARQVLYCLSRAGLLVEAGRARGRKLYRPASRRTGRRAQTHRGDSGSPEQTEG